MALVENVRHFLEELVKGYTRLVVAFLRDLVQTLEILDLQNVLVDQELEEVLGFFDELYMAVEQIDLIKDLLLDYPRFLYIQFKEIPLFQHVKIYAICPSLYPSTHATPATSSSAYQIPNTDSPVSSSGCFQTAELTNCYKLKLNLKVTSLHQALQT